MEQKQEESVEWVGVIKLVFGQVPTTSPTYWDCPCVQLTVIKLDVQNHVQEVKKFNVSRKSLILINKIRLIINNYI